MIKKIIIIGQKKVGKTKLFRYFIEDCFSSEKMNFSPLINHNEKLIMIYDNVYKIIDTPEFFIKKNEKEIEKKIKENILKLIEKSDLVLWLIDKFDEEVIFIKKYLKKINKKTLPIFVEKKNRDMNNFSISFKEEIFENSFFINYFNKKIIEKLKERIKNIFFDYIFNESIEEKINIMIYGPPNSGKSTLMNHLLKENRSIVSDISGTTKEPVIASLKLKKNNFKLLDTAGITKKIKIALKIWRESDIVWAIIDAYFPITKQILQIINLSEKYNKALIIVINKKDLINNESEIINKLKKHLKSLRYCPLIFISALNGTGINSLIKVFEEMLEESKKNFSKIELENHIKKMTDENPPNYYQNGKLKIYFVKHKKKSLIHDFIFFVNNPKWAHFSYQRYISNYLRNELRIKKLPINIRFKKSV